MKAILAEEVAAAIKAVDDLETTLIGGPEQGKEKEWKMDDVTTKYHQGLVGVLTKELKDTMKLVKG